MYKHIAARLPVSLQHELRRFHYARQIRRDRFEITEPEYVLLHTLVSPGDCVIDIGANIGFYTKRLSDLVGVHGRVIALEPVPSTFALLTSNVQHFHHANVTLINAAASHSSALVEMTMPTFSTGLKDFYEAHITAKGEVSALALCVDALSLPSPVSLVKIDVEGHEAAVLRGMTKLLHCDHPTLIVEAWNDEAEHFLCTFGYRAERLPGSPNVLFRHTMTLAPTE